MAAMLLLSGPDRFAPARTDRQATIGHWLVAALMRPAWQRPGRSDREDMGIGRAATVAAAARATGGSWSWRDRITALPAVARSALSGTGQVSRPAFLLAVSGLLYVLSPLDFLPEALLGPFGLGDDLAIAAVALAFLARAADQVLTGDPADVVEGTVVARQDQNRSD